MERIRAVLVVPTCSRVRIAAGRLLMLFLCAFLAVLDAKPTQVHRSDLPHGIPDLATQATTRAVRNGPWSDPLTWSEGRVPVGEAVVRVPRNITVTYDVVSDEPL